MFYEKGLEIIFILRVKINESGIIPSSENDR